MGIFLEPNVNYLADRRSLHFNKFYVHSEIFPHQIKNQRCIQNPVNYLR